MTSLINPDIGYILVVLGFGLTIFAVLTPGTGIFEIGALVAIVLVGWQMYNLPINLWALIVLILSIVPYIFAVRRVRKNLNLNLSIGAFVIGSLFMFRLDQWWQLAINVPMGITISIISGGLLWLMSDKVIESQAATPAHDLGSLIGSIGEAKTKIYAEGSVYVKGEMWTAYSEKPIKAGSEVEVLEREGFILKVQKN